MPGNITEHIVPYCKTKIALDRLWNALLQDNQFFTVVFLPVGEPCVTQSGCQVSGLHFGKTCFSCCEFSGLQFPPEWAQTIQVTFPWIWGHAFVPGYLKKKWSAYWSSKHRWAGQVHRLMKLSAGHYWPVDRHGGLGQLDGISILCKWTSPLLGPLLSTTDWLASWMKCWNDVVNELGWKHVIEAILGFQQNFSDDTSSESKTWEHNLLPLMAWCHSYCLISSLPLLAGRTMCNELETSRSS